MKMKKRASTILLVMWIILIYLSVAAVTAKPVTQNVLQTAEAIGCTRNGFYQSCGASKMGGEDSTCATARPNRSCSHIDSDTM